MLDTRLAKMCALSVKLIFVCVCVTRVYVPVCSTAEPKVTQSGSVTRTPHGATANTAVPTAQTGSALCSLRSSESRESPLSI